MHNEDQPDYRLLSKTTPVARKAHECSFCKEPIPPGIKYDSYAYLLDGDFEHLKAHRRCPRELYE